jgi:heptosyltransferase-1
VEEHFQDIPRMHPQVDRVIPVAIRRWRKQLLRKSTWQEMAEFQRQLTAQTYDVILDTQGLLKSALIGLLAKGTRHGQDRQSAREPLAACTYQNSYHIPRHQHAVERNRQLAAQALGYKLKSISLDYGLSGQVLTEPHAKDILKAPYVVGLHATSRDSKLWPIEYWIALGHLLSSQSIQLLLPWGSHAEQHRASLIAAAVQDASVLPRLRLTQLAAILSGASAAVGVDTGLMHLATAVKCPSIAIYTDTDPALTGLHAASEGHAINLGGKNQVTSPEVVWTQIMQFLPPTN